MNSAAEASSSSPTRSPLANAPSPTFAPLAEWLRQKGCDWNPSLQVEYDQYMGWRVIAKDTIGVGSTLCAIPKCEVLSHRTASFSSYLPIDVSEASSTDAILQLSACLLHELRLGKKSEYWGYTQLLPRETVVLPSFWEDPELGGEDGHEALKWLEGTEGERELARKRSEGLSLDDLRSFHDVVKDVFPPTDDHKSPPSFHHFLYAYSMVCTRAFVIDNYHTIGMIPFCDLFNHSNTGHSSLLSDQSVCPICGALSVCEHDGDASPNRLDTISEEYLEQVKQEGMKVDMRAEKAIEPGQEVFSCYEPGLGDAKLLVEWGFVGGEKAGQGLTWSPRELITPANIKAYIAILRGIPADIPLDERIAPPSLDQFGILNVSPDGQISIGLLAAAYLRSAVSTTSELENEDDPLRFVDVLRTLINGKSDHKADAEHVAVISTVVSILQERLAKMHRPELSVSELHRTLSTLQNEPLQRMAVTLAIQERELLTSVIDRCEK